MALSALFTSDHLLLGLSTTDGERYGSCPHRGGAGLDWSVPTLPWPSPSIKNGAIYGDQTCAAISGAKS